MNKTSSYKEALFESLRSDSEEAEAYLNAAYEDSPEAFLKALGNVAQAHQMSKIAKETGLQRESLYRALCEQGNPTFHTLFSVLKALDIAVTFGKSNLVTGIGRGAELGNDDARFLSALTSDREGQSLQSFAVHCMSGQRPGDGVGSISNGQALSAKCFP